MFSSRPAAPRHASTNARRLVGALAALLAATTGLGTALPASAAEIYPRPAVPTLTIDGRGWGHGIGMSQYGALGGARAGASWRQILGFYYPGTAYGDIGNPTVRVRVHGISDAVYAATLPSGDVQASWPGRGSGIRLSSCAGSAGAPWRYVAAGRTAGTPTTLLLQCRPSPGSAWMTYTTVPGQLAWFENPTGGTVTTYEGTATTMGTPVVYRGQVRAGLIGPAGAETLTPIVATPMESYLRSVVPSEMPASWPPDALAAQAVAARSYAENQRRYAPASPQWYDVSDGTSSQVFNGTRRGSTSYEYAASDAAVAATGRQALLSGGGVALTMFSSSNGGWTADGGKPYLVAKADPWDATPGNGSHAWRTTVSVAAIESAFPAIGRFRSLRITSRAGAGEWRGRVGTVVLTGSDGSVTVSGARVRQVLGLRSDWFKPLGVGVPRDVTADGNTDLVAVAQGSGALYVYPTDGTGGWRPRVGAASGGWTQYPKAFTAGTWDADAVSDLMYQTGNGDLYLAPGTGDGTFGAARRVGTGWQVHNLVFPAGDVDGDGRTDLLARRASDGRLVLYPGTGDGGFAPSREVGWGWNGLTAVFSPGDFDGDGIPDVLARRADGGLWLYPGNGTGGFRAARQVGSGWAQFASVTGAGDVDGDGSADVLASASDGTLWLYRGDGAGGWLGQRRAGSGWSTFSVLS
ncbi:MAG TPA: SpoIID/LytB domain-containing protein [Intrasporangium sp.]|uniref:SpoIID/LytB domain-containing protein n=1 Tax=Intrasporangium sp. TaxID=1925024 RepID=UPI002D792002|nr:SpoIID/LytB domain-containing protein [Intrasporangium sp.]HET7399940.1 SpoIID/LytB domain-containing protein [Intrasporangium sp.]